MASISDYPQRSSLSHSHDVEYERPRRRRFRLFAALTAPFRDMDDRALHKKRKHVEVRNNSKGNLFAPSAAAPVEVPVVRRFPRSGD